MCGYTIVVLSAKDVRIIEAYIFEGWTLLDFFNWDIHLTQPNARCSIGLWKDTRGT